jgi:hypothetical protein
MKKLTKVMQITFFLALIASYSYTSMAQDARPRKSPKAAVSQTLGVDTEIVIEYGRPGVKGRTIWGELVPYAMNPGNKYSNNKPFPWRAGANENTTISFNSDLLIEGEQIPAGKYSIHMLPGEEEFKIMFNKVSDAWGSYTYDEGQNALVVTVEPVESAHTEWLEYGFSDLSDDSAMAYLRWDDLTIPFAVKLAQ